MAHDCIDIPTRKKGFSMIESSIPKDFRTWRVIVLGVLGAMVLLIGAILMFYFVISSHWLAGQEIKNFYSGFWGGLSIFTLRSFMTMNALIASLGVIVVLASIWVLYQFLKLLTAFVGAKIGSYQVSLPESDNGQVLQESISSGVKVAIEEVREEQIQQQRALPENVETDNIDKDDLKQLKRAVNHVKKVMQ